MKFTCVSNLNEQTDEIDSNHFPRTKASGKLEIVPLLCIDIYFFTIMDYSYTNEELEAFVSFFLRDKTRCLVNGLQ